MNFNASRNHAKIPAPYLRTLCLKVQTYFHGLTSSLTNSSGDQIPFSRIILHRIVGKYRGLLEWDCHNAPDLTSISHRKRVLSQQKVRTYLGTVLCSLITLGYHEILL